MSAIYGRNELGIKGYGSIGAKIGNAIVDAVERANQKLTEIYASFKPLAVHNHAYFEYAHILELKNVKQNENSTPLEELLIVARLNEAFEETQLDWSTYPRELFPKTTGLLSEQVKVKPARELRNEIGNLPINLEKVHVVIQFTGICSGKPLQAYQPTDDLEETKKTGRSYYINCYPYLRHGCQDNENHLGIPKQHFGKDGVNEGNRLFHTILALNENLKLNSPLKLGEFNLEKRSITILNSKSYMRGEVQGWLKGDMECLESSVYSSWSFNIQGGGNGRDWELVILNNRCSLELLSDSESVLVIRRALEDGNQVTVFAFREIYQNTLLVEANLRTDLGEAPALTEKIKQDPTRLKHHSNSDLRIVESRTSSFESLEPALAETYEVITAITPLTFIDEYLLGIIKVGDMIQISSILSNSHDRQEVGMLLAINPEPPKIAKEIVIGLSDGTQRTVPIRGDDEKIDTITLLKKQ